MRPVGGRLVVPVCLVLLAGSTGGASGATANAPAAERAAAGDDMASVAAAQPCPRPGVGTELTQPEDLQSVDGRLEVRLSILDYRTPEGVARYCYLTPDGHEAPTLRVHPGDRVILHLTNRLRVLEPDGAGRTQRLPAMSMSMAMPMPAAASAVGRERARDQPCASAPSSATATNLHFHGLTLAPHCHADDVLHTAIAPGALFTYDFYVPENEPPGLYWYHPHIHGFTNPQVMGGAAGALIVEGLERSIPEVAGLAEQVLVIRDLPLMHPDAPPSTAEPVVPKPTLDPDGDIANNNTGFGQPARDLSVNFVPVPYPDYIPARLRMRPGEKQLWRVLNAASITYVHLALLVDRLPQSLGVVAIDGVPVNFGDAAAPHVKPVDHLVIPPGGRAELIVTAPPAGHEGLLISRTVNTGQDGENVPNRALVAIATSGGAAPVLRHVPAASGPPLRPTLPWIGSVTPVRTRKLYFSERRSDPKDPQSPVVFFITEEGRPERAFDPAAPPNIVVRQGDVEDWVIENRSLELHAFHIHQLHFQLRQWYGYQVNEPFLRDTVSVPFFDNHMTAYPSVTVRMDFRDPNIVGTFMYHCHLLEHEDAGMMGTIRVEPAATSAARQPSQQ